MKKTSGQKSRATVPLRTVFGTRSPILQTLYGNIHLYSMTTKYVVLPYFCAGVWLSVSTASS
jgi:hypothetical protein